MDIYSAAHKMVVTVTCLYDNRTWGNGVRDWVGEYGYSNTAIPNPYQGHKGIDLVGSPRGCKIYAPISGYAQVVRNVDNRGNCVIITSGNVQYRLMHMASLLINDGNIKAGDAIGTQGNTGLSYGEHLHVDISVDGKYVDPYNFIQESQNDSNLQGDDDFMVIAPKLLKREAWGRSMPEWGNGALIGFNVNKPADADRWKDPFIVHIRPQDQLGGWVDTIVQEQGDFYRCEVVTCDWQGNKKERRLVWIEKAAFE
ncbi:M23 family metallopeptidase [Culicoidibacter larvae]|uniref:M23 family metallopeptidase n=1 Tax=Culicoidibacter larvae TaxID=2579976 RepID=A0A5R8Q9J4_9FIRM|nr:M23 family metallopeptidase [Culicoidibacter larvae]TLG72039.1 M23 family metallopeptidase [Culicoidibacter larvae]